MPRSSVANAKRKIILCIFNVFALIFLGHAWYTNDLWMFVLSGGFLVGLVTSAVVIFGKSDEELDPWPTSHAEDLHVACQEIAKDHGQVSDIAWAQKSEGYKAMMNEAMAKLASEREDDDA